MVKPSKLSGNSPEDIANWYAEHTPDVDRLSIEAHVLLNRVYMQISARNEVGKESLFTSGRFNVLSLLDRAGERGLLMSEVAAGISISITNLPKLMDDLVARKLITRTRDAEDGRKRWAHLTAAGRELLEKETPRAAQSIKSAWESLSTEEKQMLVDLFTKLVEDFPDHSSRHWA